MAKFKYEPPAIKNEDTKSIAKDMWTVDLREEISQEKHQEKHDDYYSCGCSKEDIKNAQKIEAEWVTEGGLTFLKTKDNKDHTMYF